MNNNERAIQTMAFTGDVAFSKYFEGLENADILSKEIIDFLRESDNVAVNVEGPISNIHPETGGRFCHVNSPEICGFLNSINATVWNFGNNHITDSGRQGVEESVGYARKNNCAYLGVNDNYSMICGSDIKIGLISITRNWKKLRTQDGSPVTLRSNQTPKIKEEINKLRESVDWLIVVSHDGCEFSSMPFPNIRDKYHQYLSWGADIVIGHHPHCIQNYETVADNKMIFYSLGNFVFDTDYQRKQKYTDNGMLVKFRFGKNDFTWEACPVHIDRKEMKIGKTETPKIFADINEKEYLKLYPLAVKQYVKTRRVFYPEQNSQNKKRSKLEWLIFDYRKRHDALHKALLIGRIRALFRPYRRSSHKAVVDYLKSIHQ